MSVDPSRNVPAPQSGPGMHDVGAGIGEVISNTIQGIGSALAGVFTPGGLFGPVGEAAESLRDGQEELNDRTDLLSPLLDYGSVSMPAGQPSRGIGFLPFSRQIGPARGVSVKRGNSNNAWGLEFQDKGLWDVRLHCTASWIIGATGLAEVHLNIYRPNGDFYSQQRSVLVGMRYGLADGDGEQTHTINSSVVIPEAGYYALVYVQRCAPLRHWLGGPAWSRLTAQHITREVDGNWDTGAGGSDNNEDGS